jgi:protease YdgD
VVTAAHCLYDIRSDRVVGPGELHFLAGYRRGEYLDHATGRRVNAPNGGRARDEPVLERVATDWAIVQLDHPLSVRPIPVRTLASADVVVGSAGTHLLRAGYSQDRPHLLSMHSGCAVVDRAMNDRVLVSDCDATRGDSGSPLLLVQQDKVFLVGVTSAVTQSGSTGASLIVHASAFEADVMRPAAPNRSK